MDIKKVIKESLTISPLMEGKEKVTIDELIARETPVVIIGIDPVSIPDKLKGGMSDTYVVATPTEFFFAPTVLVNVFNNLMEAFKGDLTAINAELERGYVMLSLYKKTNSKGIEYTAAEIL